MRVCVTGSEGNLMQATIAHLRKSGHQVRGVDHQARHGRVSRARDYEFVEGDLTDPRVAERSVEGCELVIQAAGAAYGVLGMDRRPADLLFNDVTVQANVVRAAVRAGARKLAYVSSSMLYENCTRLPMAEDDPDRAPAPRTELGISKLLGERVCHAATRQYGLRTTVWRPFNIIAPTERGEREQGISHVFADFIQAVAVERKAELQVLGDGQQVRSFVWVGDIAAAIAEFSAAPSTDGRTYNVGSPETVTMLELAQRIHARAKALGLLGRDAPLRIRHGPAPPKDVRTLVPDLGRIQKELGWRPSVPLDQALDQCILAAVGRTP